MAYGQVNADVISTSVANTSLGAGNASRFKNRIINGDMRIDQRNAGASGTAGGYTVDRWYYAGSQASKGTWQQNAGSVTPPTGFINYLGFTSSSAYSVTAGDYFAIGQPIEGLNIADLAWGTANAKTVTLSFQVYSSLTGTFGGALQNSGATRNYPFSYSIPTANTWTQISITIAGDTSGTWLTTNGTGVTVNFSLGYGTTYSGTAGAWSSTNYGSATGATSVVGTNGATFYITGVQLEVGSSATGFDYVDYTTQLSMCQRYYEYESGTILASATNAGIGNSYGSASFFKISKRTSPTLIIYPAANLGGTANNANWYGSGVGVVTTAAITLSGVYSFSIQQTGNSGYGLVTYSFSASSEL